MCINNSVLVQSYSVKVSLSYCEQFTMNIMKIKFTKETKALCCISLAWFLVLAGRYSISNLLPRIVTELNFSWTDAGFALTIMWLIYAIIQFPSGIFSDIKG